MVVLALSSEPTAQRCGVGPFGESLEPRVESLLPELSRSPLPLGHHARILPLGSGEVRVLLLDEQGAEVAERTLPTDGSCEGLARAVAVVVAAWSQQLAAPQLVAEAEPEPVAPALEPSAPPYSPGPLRWRAEAGLLGALAGEDWAVGAVGRYSLPLGPLHGQLSVGGTSNRRLGLSSGEVAWRRSWVGLGAAYPFWRTSAIELHVSGAATAALARLEGRGFDTNLKSWEWDAGLTAGLSLYLLPGHWLKPWLGAQGAYWLRHLHADVAGSGRRGDLPYAEFWLTAGIAVGPP